MQFSFIESATIGLLCSVFFYFTLLIQDVLALDILLASIGGTKESSKPGQVGGT